jgi:hypothetical protein
MHSTSISESSLSLTTISSSCKHETLEKAGESRARTMPGKKVRVEKRRREMKKKKRELKRVS